MLLYLLIPVFIFLALWFLFWSDLILWSDPMKVTPDEFLKTNIPLPKVGHEEYDKKFCIVGAGFCGLGVSAALKRHGIPFDILEKSDSVGGNWYHGVYETVHIISSRKTTEYKDYPMPESYGDFPSAKQMKEYFDNYAKHFGLLEHIQFEKNVIHCEYLEKDNHKWKVTLVDQKTGKEETRIYKGIIIANGHHWDSRMPQYEGKFTGEIIHSKQYKNPDQLKNKKVLIVGGGNSACDIAVEAARFSKSSHISLRRGYWFAPRTVMGKPFVEWIKPWMPIWFQQILFQFFIRIINGNFENYGLQNPDHNIFEHHPTINSELLHNIKLGEITPHVNIKKLENKNVYFEDGTSDEFDMIIYCTGYYTSIPLLKKYIKIKDNIPQLIMGIFEPKLRNCYYFGMGQPRYGAGPLITAGADFLAKAIRVQEKLTNNIGLLLQKVFRLKYVQKAPKSQDVLMDPHWSFKQAMIARVIIGFLVYAEKWFFSNLKEKSL